MDEECDYMSDDILKACETNDVRPGLVHSRSKQREYDMLKRKERSNDDKKKAFLTKKHFESEQLAKGLEKPIGEDNKGFSLMMKMGFKPGTSLGASQSGIKEPIGINLKNDRQGLGREQAIKDIRQMKRQYREQRKEETVTDFRANLSKKQRERECSSDLYKSAKACFRLDSEAGITRPDEDWFWPQHCLPTSETNEESEEKDESDEEEDKVEYSDDIKLQLLTLYLRKSYCFCNWCGVKFDDERDLSKSCPGSTSDDH